jgi:Methionine aminopeptidase
MITLKTEDQLGLMRQAGRIVADVLRFLRDRVRPGVDTYSLDEEAYAHVVKCGARPAFKGYRVPGIKRAFPGTLCISINEEVVHGIPDRRRFLEEGDIVSFDMGVEYRGYYGDAACTTGSARFRTNVASSWEMPSNRFTARCRSYATVRPWEILVTLLKAFLSRKVMG